jgi:FimV-like protein
VWDLREKKPDTPIGVRHLTRAFTLVTLVCLGCAWASSWAATDSYTTQPGDSLWEIATRYIKDETISPQQMMLALFRTNPGAFVNTNINRLKTGVVLRIPAREEILATRFADAVTEVAQPPSLAASDEPSERVATETFADNEVLRTRIATLEERLAKLDGVITVQHERLAELQQHLAESQARASAQTAAGREDVASAVPGEGAPPAAVTSTPTMEERPQVGLTLPSPLSRIAVWLADPKIVMAVGGVALLGLTVMWLRVRRMTAHKAAAKMATAAVAQTRVAPPAAVEDDAFVFDNGDLEIGREGVSETTLANLMLDVDDLDLDQDQGREEGTGDGVALPRLSNTASSSRKAGEASP